MLGKVSIIIPTYNGEKYIKETIESCLNQTYEIIEIIVVDDCSTDNTVKILESFKGKIKFTKNKINLGIAKNLNNIALDLDGEYFIFLGHDDILPIKHIEIMLSEFDDNIVAVHCNSIIIDEKGNGIELARNDNIQKIKTENIMFELSIDNFISSCGMVHKAKVFKKLKGWSEEYKNYGEWLYYIKCLDYGEVKYTALTRALYRKHNTNITNTFKDPNVRKGLNEYKNYCRKLAFSKHKYSLSEYIKYYKNYYKFFLKGIL